jgi:hypothetical protein
MLPDAISHQWTACQHRVVGPTTNTHINIGGSYTITMIRTVCNAVLQWPASLCGVQLATQHVHDVHNSAQMICLC